ncbi:hypothetical protein Tco_0000334 [Tanacetum coccineum]
MTHLSPKRNMVPKAVLMRSGLVSLTTARPVNIAQPKTTVNSTRPMTNVFNKAHSTVRRPINNKIETKNSNFNKRANNVSGKNVNTARPKEVVNAARLKAVLNDVKGNQCINYSEKGNPQIDLQDQGVINSGCSRHMTGNMSYLTNFEEIDGGYVVFGGNPKGEKITGRGSNKTVNVQRFKDKLNKPMTYAQQKAFMRTFVKNQSSTIYTTGWTMKHVKSFSDDQLKTEFDKIRTAAAELQSQNIRRSLKQPGADLEQASSKKSKSTEAPKSEMFMLCFTSTISSDEKERLGQKGVHPSHSTIPIEAVILKLKHKCCLKWELLPTGLGWINVIYKKDNSRKCFTSLREILHLVTRADLMTIYGRVMTFYQDKKAAGVGLVLWGDLKVLMDSPEVNDGSDVWKNQQTWKIQSWKLYSYSGVHVLETVGGLVVHMFVDKKYPLSVNLIERMLDHQLEICQETVGNELTTAVQLIAFLKKQIADSRRPKVHDWYVVPTGKDNVIVSAGRTKVIPAGRLEDLSRAGPTDIKEMKDVFESTESELCELEKQNDFLKDQLLEASLKHEVELSVLLNHECVDKSLHAEIEQIKKKSIEIQKGLQAGIKILKKDVQRCEKQSVDFELKLQHEKEKHKWDSILKNKSTNPLHYSWISKMEKLKDENVSLDFKVKSLIKERDNVKLEYQ